MQCERCNGECWDEAAGKYWFGGKDKEGKQKPRWRCKNKQGCGWSKFEATTQPAGDRGSQSLPGATAKPSGPLAPVYTECYATAARVVAHYAKQLGQPYSMADVTAACATMFIQAAQSGRPITAPKDPPKVEPKPAPKPTPAYVPEPEDLPFN